MRVRLPGSGAHALFVCGPRPRGGFPAGRGSSARAAWRAALGGADELRPDEAVDRLVGHAEPAGRLARGDLLARQCGRLRVAMEVPECSGDGRS